MSDVHRAGALCESYVQPLAILWGLPSAGFGALLTLYLFHMDLNIYAFAGLIMLIGSVKKDAINNRYAAGGTVIAFFPSELRRLTGHSPSRRLHPKRRWRMQARLRGVYRNLTSAKYSTAFSRPIHTRGWPRAKDGRGRPRVILAQEPVGRAPPNGRPGDLLMAKHTEVP